ncbi:hypothetical protein GSI_15539 [Ganoderma sinense ZZ0214-1]|uniref:Uncharacterized protein n=1 Tax=Ganoderma sinense ZZ0214-1 TaxID=1077348 RepID=A0A2G8RMV0_9APHY|nr:hypothetical protein GSI_15539 [Ganoderma sinense ZZ0214-1]
MPASMRRRQHYSHASSRAPRTRAPAAVRAARSRNIGSIRPQVCIRRLVPCEEGRLRIVDACAASSQDALHAPLPEVSEPTRRRPISALPAGDVADKHRRARWI